MKYDEQVSALEKQVEEIEKLVAKLLPDDDADGKTRKRYRPGDALAKAKKKSDASDEDFSDLEDDEYEDDDMDKNEKLAKAEAEKAAAEKAAVEKAAAEKAAVEKAAADKAAAEKLAKEDESVTIEGQTINKSAVGNEVFAIFKAQAEKQDKLAKELGEERDLRKMAELKKQADEQYPNIPGSVDERASMLKAIEGMDEPLRKSFTAVLTSAQKLSKMAFETLGSDGGRDPVTSKAFESKVADIKKRDNCTQQEAMQKARREFPEEFKAYQGVAN